MMGDWGGVVFHHVIAYCPIQYTGVGLILKFTFKNSNDANSEIGFFS